MALTKFDIDEYNKCVPYKYDWSRLEEWQKDKVILVVEAVKKHGLRWEVLELPPALIEISTFHDWIIALERNITMELASLEDD